MSFTFSVITPPAGATCGGRCDLCRPAKHKLKREIKTGEEEHAEEIKRAGLNFSLQKKPAREDHLKRNL